MPPPGLRLPVLFLTLALAIAPAAAHAADTWTTPTPEELSMTSQPEVPGAPAVYLFREELTEDSLHMFSIYARIKILSDAGKDMGNVELDYALGRGGFTVTDILARTIHSDGTVIPFAGKPYEKLVDKAGSVRHMAKVFSLPDVQVGSILEYRYKLRIDDNFFMAPQWYIQSDLFTRRAHYSWKPTNHNLLTNDDREQLTTSISWTPVLPTGAEVKLTTVPGARNFSDQQRLFQLDVKDIPPRPTEEYMPPMRSLSYRVLFYYSAYAGKDEFWKKEGKYWSKHEDKFIGPGPGVHAAAAELASPSDTPEVKLAKFYAAVQRMENTDFSRERSSDEDKGAGLREVKTADDILARKRGTGEQLNDLFVALARASGMKAYVMAVSDRSRRIFFPAYMSLDQLDAHVAIVEVDGKERFYDPGTPFCPVAHLAWRHASSAGLRQTPGGAEIANSPGESYKASSVKRIADLILDEHGVASGVVKITYEGSPAMDLRQVTLRRDEDALERELRERAQQELPPGLELHLTSINKVTDSNSPLTVEFSVKGTPGSPTGKRLLLTGDLFEARSQPTFSHEKRELAVYFNYPYASFDAVRIHLPPQLAIESLPEKGALGYQNLAQYTYVTESTPDTYTVRRNYFLGETIFLPKEYPELRTFYSQMETKDRQTVVLKAAGAPAHPPASGGN